MAEVQTWPLQPRVSYISVMAPCDKTFPEGLQRAPWYRRIYKCLRSDQWPKRGKQSIPEWAGGVWTEQTNPEGEIRMQGAGAEDIERRPLHTNTDIYRGLLMLTWTLLTVLPIFYLTAYEEEFPQLFKSKFSENDTKCWSLAIKCISIEKCW